MLTMAEIESETQRLLRWAASLRRSSAATLAEAERHGREWEFYELSIASGTAQASQAKALELKADQMAGEFVSSDA